MQFPINEIQLKNIEGYTKYQMKFQCVQIGFPSIPKHRIIRFSGCIRNYVSSIWDAKVENDIDFILSW